MLNPKIIYIAVAVVFIYIVAKFKLMPYLAAKKILKDSKKNGTQQTSAQPLSDQNAPALPPSYMLSAMQALLNAGSSPVPAPAPKPERRDMYYDYTLVEIPDRSDEPDDSKQNAETICTAVNKYILDLRNYCICPDYLGIVHLTDRAFIIYVTYTV